MRTLLLSVIAAAVFAQQPSIINANLQSVSAASGLEQAIRTAIAKQTAPIWIGYAVPRPPGDGHSCCWNNNNRGCGLEGQSTIVGASPTTPIQLEGPTHAVMLFRAEQGKVGRLRTFSLDCPLDAGGLTVVWLTNVRPAENVAMLSRYISDETNEKIRDQALFALTQVADPSAVPALIHAAKENTSVHTRGQALFWLAHMASRPAKDAITDSIERDPNTEVKKKAVFALTQLPKDEGVPLLIQIARANANPAVRKQAMFWLGQSRDPRALKFFEDVLAK